MKYEKNVHIVSLHQIEGRGRASVVNRLSGERNFPQTSWSLVSLQISRCSIVLILVCVGGTTGLAKMLAVFKRSVAESPEELTSPHSLTDARKNGTDLMESFVSTNPGVVCIKLGDAGAMAYTHNKQLLFKPRSFAAIDDMFCVFEGYLENIAVLRQQYGLNKSANEVTIVIESFRTLRDRGPYPADQVVRGLNGKFAFVLFDTTSQTLFTAADADGSVPFFWGTAADGHLALSDDPSVLKEGCGKSFAPFPRGCFFTTSGGLQSFEHPLNMLKPMPRVDSQGQMCGATFKVDTCSKKDSGMHRVGSEANWSSHF